MRLAGNATRSSILPPSTMLSALNVGPCHHSIAAQRIAGKQHANRSEGARMNHSRRRFLQAVSAGTGIIGASAAGRDGRTAGSAEGYARAVDFEQSVAYRPAEHPGYCSWVTAWKGPNGSLLLNLCERRRGSNPIHRPIPLDFWEGMSLPIKFDSQLCTDPGILPETVILESRDQGKSWREAGRTLPFF